MAGKLSARRRVSSSTTAPIAPRTRSSHMNQKRCCPGVPNRYRIRSRSRERRPKSMATVVVCLFGVWARSSMPAEASVITASVVSGTISETAPTNVVLPTPKPPATTIFVEVSPPPLEPAKSTEHPFQERPVRQARLQLRTVDTDEPLGLHVRDDHPGHTERDAEQRRDLGDRTDLPAELTDRPVLPRVPQPELERGHRGDQRLHGQRGTRRGTSSGEGVHPHQRALLLLALIPRTHVSLRSPGAHRGQLSPDRRREHLPGALHQNGHLVGDQAHVAGRRGQHRQAGTVADGDHQHQSVLHLHHRLLDPAALEDPGGALDQTDQSRRDRRELVGAVGGKTLGVGDRQPVGGDHHGVRDARHLSDETADQPVDVFGRPAHLHQMSSSISISARPFRTPCWNPSSRLRIRSGESVGGGIGGPADLGPALPGTRLARGVRLGRPAPVRPPRAGSAADRAASHPGSAAEVHGSGAGLSAGSPWADGDGRCTTWAGVSAWICGTGDGTAWAGVSGCSDRSGVWDVLTNQFGSAPAKLGGCAGPASIGGFTAGCWYSVSEPLSNQDRGSAGTEGAGCPKPPCPADCPKPLCPKPFCPKPLCPADCPRPLCPVGCPKPFCPVGCPKPFCPA